MDDIKTAEFYFSLPKIELHAHLNASLSEDTVKGLMKRSSQINAGKGSTMIGKSEKTTLDESFDMFKIIHQLTSNVEVISEITQSVINDFARENVYYLELRSTPRADVSTGMTKRSYIDALLKGVQECESVKKKLIDVRLLLSIDRRQGVEEANNTVLLAKEYYKSTNGLVIGVDFSGDPKIGCGKDYIPALLDAKKSGLQISVHMAEIDGMDDENLELLKLPPDRIGHGTFLFESEDCRRIVLEKSIPVEVCLSSNVKTGTVTSFEHHHFQKWNNLNHPVIICTDGKGVFSTSISNEYKIASQASGLNPLQMFDLSKNSINCIFGNCEMKRKLFERWDLWKKENELRFC